MDLNGKAGTRLAIILTILFFAVVFYAEFGWNPNTYMYYPYSWFKPEAKYSVNGVSIGDEIPVYRYDRNLIFARLFDGNKYVMGEYDEEYDEDYIVSSDDDFMVSGLIFKGMDVAIVEDTLRQVRYSKAFFGWDSYWKSKKYYKSLCYTLKETYGNNLNSYLAWEWKKDNPPKSHSFGVRIIRERIGRGFYEIVLLFTHPQYEDEDICSGRDFWFYDYY